MPKLLPELGKLIVDQPLRGRIVELHILAVDDYAELAPSCLDPEIWRSTIAKISTKEQLRDYLDRGLQQLADGTAVPLLIRLTATGVAVGSTRLAVGHAPGVVEIGWTFIAPAYHRRGVNVEAKLLLLDYSFDVLGCTAVIFKIASGNERSKAALLKLGAEPFGSKNLPDDVGGVAIHWFCMPAAAWPVRRQHLEKRLLPV